MRHRPMFNLQLCLVAFHRTFAHIIPISKSHQVPCSKCWIQSIPSMHLLCEPSAYLQRSRVTVHADLVSNASRGNPGGYCGCPVTRPAHPPDAADEPSAAEPHPNHYQNLTAEFNLSTRAINPPNTTNDPAACASWASGGGEGRRGRARCPSGS